MICEDVVTGAAVEDLDHCLDVFGVIGGDVVNDVEVLAAEHALQLLAIGYFLAYIFGTERSVVVVAILAAMLFVASWIALRPVRGGWERRLEIRRRRDGSKAGGLRP